MNTVSCSIDNERYYARLGEMFLESALLSYAHFSERPIVLLSAATAIIYGLSG